MTSTVLGRLPFWVVRLFHVSQLSVAWHVALQERKWYSLKNVSNKSQIQNESWAWSSDDIRWFRV